jgi:DNA-binding NtrC family response regulator
MVKAGSFREDLYFRLSVVPIHLPPMRERPGDLPLLAQHFLKESARENEKPVRGMTPEAFQALAAYRWPGNVRELRTAIEHAVVLCRGETIGLRDLPASVRREQEGTDALGAARLLERGEMTVKDAERELIVRALRESGGSRTLAARKIGMSRRTLHRKLHHYHLEGL